MPVLVQRPESCVVAGMPRAVMANGHHSAMGDPAELGYRLRRMTLGALDGAAAAAAGRA